MSNKLEHSLSLTQKQHLIFTPQMQRALYLLQLPVMELSTLITKELEENPVLEFSEENNYEGIEFEFRNPKALVKKEDEDLRTFLENTISYESSLFEYLMEQAKDLFSNEEDLAIAEDLIGNMDESGFLSLPLEEIALLTNREIKSLLPILEKIQALDPPGILARDLRESLLIQLERLGKKEKLPYQIVEHHFEDLIHNRLPHISKKLKIPPSSIKKAIESEILPLEFHPGTSFPRGHYSELAPSICPDFFISGKECTIEINERYIPSFRINPYYLSMLTNESLPKETKEYINTKIASGKWLLRTLDERQHTLYRIAEILVEKEREFLIDPKGKLSPITMKEVAEMLSLNESTVARAVSNKYVGCQRGILSLRSFFTHGYQVDSGEEISVVTIKEELFRLIDGENKQKPYSDETLAKLLNKQGIPLARRTVAKYRAEFGIGTTLQRKSHT